MAAPSTPTNFAVSQANGSVYVQWDLTATATSYKIYRSTDGVTYGAVYATSVIPNYTDTGATVGTQYWYTVAASNIDGDSAVTSALSVIPAPTGEMSLQEIRLRSQQRADRVNSQFVTTNEWNFFINQAMQELYNILIDTYEDYFMAPRVRFYSSGSNNIYALPNGSNTFLDSNYQTVTPPPFYKLLGVDLALSTAPQNAFVTINKFNFMDRNRFVYPNTASTIYGVFNLQYRVMGNNIEFIPTPSAGQVIQLSYIPRLSLLLKDTDLTTIGFVGFLQYVIVRAAKYALNKEEASMETMAALDAELAMLKQQIQDSAMNRDVGQPDRVTDVRQNGWWGASSGGMGWSGPIGGF